MSDEIGSVDSETAINSSKLREALENLMNGQEHISDTPDFILANFLSECFQSV